MDMWCERIKPLFLSDPESWRLFIGQCNIPNLTWSRTWFQAMQLHTLSYTCGMAILISVMYHLTLNPELAVGCSLRLCTLLSWILEWLQNTCLLPCHSGKPALSFLLSDLKVIKRRLETKYSAELHAIWLLHVLSLWWNAWSLHRYFWVSSSINWDNESSPDHLTMVMFWVPAAGGYKLSHKLKCTVDLLHEGHMFSGFLPCTQLNLWP